MLLKDESSMPHVIDATGWYARILQHEIDHLHGGLYIDRMYPRSFMSLDNYLRNWKDASIREVKAALGIP